MPGCGHAIDSIQNRKIIQAGNPGKLKFSLVIALSMLYLPLISQSGWSVVANSVWKITVGKKQPITLLSAANSAPKYDALESLAGTFSSGFDEDPF